MTSQMRKRVTIIVGFVISAVLLAWLLLQIDYAKLGDALTQVNYWWLLPNIALTASMMWLRAWRWGHMLAPIKRVDGEKLVAATCIGFMANNVLPLRLGEFVRAYSLAYQDSDVPKSTSLITIFVERMVFDLIALLVILLVVVAVTDPIFSVNFQLVMLIGVSVAILAILVMLILALRPQQVGQRLERLVRVLKPAWQTKLLDIYGKLARGVEFIKTPTRLFWVVLYTAIIWIIMGVSNYFVFLAFGFDLPLTASFLLLVAVSLSILIPSAPGFIGIFHGAAVFVMQRYNLDDTASVSFAIVLHAAQYMTLTLLGFYYLRKAHLSLAVLQEAAESDQRADSGPTVTR